MGLKNTGISSSLDIQINQIIQFVSFFGYLVKMGTMTFRGVGSQQARADCCSSEHQHRNFKLATTGIQAREFSPGFHTSMVQDAHRAGKARTLVPADCAGCWRVVCMWLAVPQAALQLWHRLTCVPSLILWCCGRPGGQHRPEPLGAPSKRSKNHFLKLSMFS